MGTGQDNSIRDIVAVLHEWTTNDRNGNPRRVWVGIDGYGHVVRVEDEGLAGRPAWVRELASAGTYDVAVEVTPRQYRERVKMGEAMAAENAQG